jgi:hypothetical protein
MSLTCSSPKILPLELLTQIITEASAHDPSAIGVFMRVSRRWYNTIINDPQFWRKVSLDLDPSSSSISRATHTAQRCIELSGTVDLDIVIRVVGVGSLCHLDEDEDGDDSDCEGCLARLDSHHTILKVLAGSDGTHLARWCNLEVYNGKGSESQQNAWVSRVLSPLIHGRPTPRLQTLSFIGWFDVRLSFSHTPLLQELTLLAAPHLHIADWNRVKKMSIKGHPPRGLLKNGAYRVMTHLVLHIPMFVSQLAFPNVVHLEISAMNQPYYVLKLPKLPRVQRILISTNIEDFWFRFSLHQYPTLKALSLRYQTTPDMVRNGHPGPTSFFRSTLVDFIKSSCTHLETLDVDSWLLDTVKACCACLLNLKQLSLMGGEVDQRSTHSSDA